MNSNVINFLSPEASVDRMKDDKHRKNTRFFMINTTLTQPHFEETKYDQKSSMKLPEELTMTKMLATQMIIVNDAYYKTTQSHTFQSLR